MIEIGIAVPPALAVVRLYSLVPQREGACGDGVSRWH